MGSAGGRYAGDWNNRHAGRFAVMSNVLMLTFDGGKNETHALRFAEDGLMLDDARWVLQAEEGE